MPQAPSFFIRCGLSLYNRLVGQRLSLRSVAASATLPVVRAKKLTRIFPPAVTPDDVSALLAQLDAAKPYSDDNWESASFDFDTFALGINIKLDDRSVGPEHIARVSTIIRILPELQSIVVSSVDGKGRKDDHGLAWIDVDVDGVGIVDLCFNRLSYNTQWNSLFKVGPDSSWAR